MNRIVVTHEVEGQRDVSEMISKAVRSLEEVRLLALEKHPYCSCGKEATTLVVRIWGLPFHERLACDEHVVTFSEVAG